MMNNPNLKGNLRNSNGKFDWHWHRISPNLKPPWYGSMKCAVRISSRLFDVINDYAKHYHRLEFIEIFVNTLPMQNNLTVINPSHLSSSISFKHNWTCEEVQSNPLWWYHPLTHNKTKFIDYCE